MTSDKSASREFLLNTEQSPYIQFERCAQPNDEAEQLGRERYRQFCRLWWQRHQREVAPEIVPFLDDPFTTMRERAIWALGRMETPLGELALQTRLDGIADYIIVRDDYYERHRNGTARVEYLQRLQEGTTKGAPSWSIKQDEAPSHQNFFLKGPIIVALARIRSRSFQGQEKLEAFAQGLGLEFVDLVHIVQKVTARQGANMLLSQVINEVVDIFYIMGRQGLDIQALGVDTFARSSVSKAKIQTACLDSQPAIELMLDYLFTPHSGSAIIGSLLEFGAPATEAMLRRLRALQSDETQIRHRHEETVNLKHFLTAVACTGDSRFIPLLEYFASHSNGNIRSAAHYPLECMRAHTIPLLDFP